MPVTARPRVLTASGLHQALVDAGVIRDGEMIRRIVIDAQESHPVIIHVERFGDERLLDVIPTLDGIEVRTRHSPAHDPDAPEGICE